MKNAFFLIFFLGSDAICPTLCCIFAADFKKHARLWITKLLILVSTKTHSQRTK